MCVFVGSGLTAGVDCISSVSPEAQNSVLSLSTPWLAPHSCLGGLRVSKYAAEGILRAGCPREKACVRSSVACVSLRVQSLIRLFLFPV